MIAQEMFDFSVLRELRKREDLTIAEVSQRSGISPAVISKLERNQTRAELETLFKLSRVFGMNAVDLLSLSEQQTAQRVQAEAYDSGDFRFERITFAKLSGFHGMARAGAKTHRPEIHRDDYELCWVLEGSLQVTLPSEQHRLGAGDSLQFDAILEHTYEALEDSRIILLHIRKEKRF